MLAVGMALVRDMPWSHTFWAGLIGLVTAAATTLAARAVCGGLALQGRGGAAPQIPALLGRFASRLTSGIVAALRAWRHNAYVRLALRRIVVLTPLVVLEAWRGTRWRCMR